MYKEQNVTIKNKQTNKHEIKHTSNAKYVQFQSLRNRQLKAFTFPIRVMSCKLNYNEIVCYKFITKITVHFFFYLLIFFY